MVLGLFGCGGATVPAASDAGRADPSATADASSPPPDGAVPRCGDPGNARLRVSLGLDPGLELRHPEVWLSIRCAGDGARERIFVWNREGTQVADALAPADYEIVASSFLAPWATSLRVTLGSATTAAVSVTLPAGPPAIAVLRSDPADTFGGAFRASVPLMNVGSAASVATMDVEARRWTTDPSYLSIVAVVHNPCVATVCAPYTLAGIEVRTRNNGQPAGLGAFRFSDAETLDAGDSRSSPQPIIVPGSLPDADHDLAVVLYGSVPPPIGP